MKKANHQTNVIRVEALLPHNNADSLELIHIGGYQVVVKKGQFNVGDLAVYVQPDSVVPQTEPFKFVWENYEGLGGIVPEKRRRITVRKFRGEWSEGLLLPMSDFFFNSSEVGGEYFSVKEGDDVSDIIGITHYDPDAGKETTGHNERSPRKYKRWPRSLKGWFYFLLYKLTGYNPSGSTLVGWDTEQGQDLPVFDVEALKNYKDVFQPEEMVIVSEKIHGSNARYMFLDGHMYAGSRTQWKSETSPCIWRKALTANPWIEEWCRAHEGYALYGEVTPTQGDKHLYGSKEPQLFVFDIRTPEGAWMGAAEFLLSGLSLAPILYVGTFAELEQANQFILDGRSTLDLNTIREGYVVRPLVERHVHGLGRAILKVVSNKFLEKDSK